MTGDWQEHVREFVPESALWAVDPARSSMEGGGSPRGMSRLTAAKNCPRLYAWRYSGTPEDPHRYYLPTELEPEARFFGTLSHVLQAYWEVSKMPEALKPSWFYEMNSDARLRKTAGTRLDMVDDVYEIFRQYVQWWSGDRFRTLGVELGLDVSVGQVYPDAPREHHHLRVSISIDRLTADPRDGMIDIMDYKFKGGWGDMLSRWTPDVSSEFMLQGHVYLTIARACGLPVRGFRVRRVKRTGLFDSDDNYVVVNDSNYAETPRIIYEYALRAHELEQKFKAGYRPWPDFGACVQRYGKCDYHRVCHTASPADQLVQLGRYIKKPVKEAA